MARFGSSKRRLKEEKIVKETPKEEIIEIKKHVDFDNIRNIEFSDLIVLDEEKRIIFDEIEYIKADDKDYFVSVKAKNEEKEWRLALEGAKEAERLFNQIKLEK